MGLGADDTSGGFFSQRTQWPYVMGEPCASLRLFKYSDLCQTSVLSLTATATRTCFAFLLSTARSWSSVIGMLVMSMVGSDLFLRRVSLVHFARLLLKGSRIPSCSRSSMLLSVSPSLHLYTGRAANMNRYTRVLQHRLAQPEHVGSFPGRLQVCHRHLQRPKRAR